jgi:glycerol-3-phosphate dehydrogenase subunit B
VRRAVVIGAGLAGLSCAVRLADEGVRVSVLATGAGSLQLGGGTLDVLGYSPDPVDRPLEALAGLPNDHPYALLGDGEIVAALDWLRTRLPALDIRGDASRNLRLATAVGAVRPTAAATASVAAGDLREGGYVVFVGFSDLKDFVPDLVAANVSRATWVDAAVNARAVTTLLPEGWEADLSPLGLARMFEEPDRRAELIDAIVRAVGVAGQARVGLPAVIGLESHAEARAQLSDALSADVFEVPTIPPSVPGIRLYRALLQALRERGGRVTIGVTAQGAATDGERISGVVARVAGRTRTFAADAVVLATGGLAVGGIELERGEVTESVLGLDLAHTPDGHPYVGELHDENPIDRAGVAVDKAFRPVDRNGNVVHPNLYAAGGILAGAVPWHELSGNGLALTTGLAAARHVLSDEGGGDG